MTEWYEASMRARYNSGVRGLGCRERLSCLWEFSRYIGGVVAQDASRGQLLTDVASIRGLGGLIGGWGWLPEGPARFEDPSKFVDSLFCSRYGGHMPVRGRVKGLVSCVIVLWAFQQHVCSRLELDTTRALGRLWDIELAVVLSDVTVPRSGLGY